MQWVIVAMTVASGVVAPLQQVAAADKQPGEACGQLYGDSDASKLVHLAKRAVPRGKFVEKRVVLKKLGIDAARLCSRRVYQFNLGYEESWQISPGFDLVWSAAVQDATPLEREDRKIFNVRIVDREKRSKLMLLPQVRDPPLRRGPA